MAALLAAVIGFFSIRLTHAYFIMLTLAFAQLVYTVIWKWSSVTGGDDGLIGFGPPHFLREPSHIIILRSIVVGICVYALWSICRSPFGRTLKAIHDNPDRTTFVGVNVRAVQLAAFVLAGAFAGVAGCLQAYFNRGMFVNSADFLTSADALVILLLGGSRWFAGPIVGAVVFKLLYITIPSVTVYWQFFLGLIILAVALFLPNGLLLADRSPIAREVRWATWPSRQKGFGAVSAASPPWTTSIWRSRPAKCARSSAPMAPARLPCSIC